MKIVCISDTHEWLGGLAGVKLDLPTGDVLVHAGDFTFRGEPVEMWRALDWMIEQPYKHKVFIAGNHDLCFDSVNTPAFLKKMEKRYKGQSLHYLLDKSVVLDGVKFYGSPWQPRFHDWAFNVDRGVKLAKIWAQIPDDTQVLVTHGPPWMIGDRTADGEYVGCKDLLARINKLPMLLVHVFGHIHAGYGTYSNFGRVSVNASICNERYKPVNLPIAVEI